MIHALQEYAERERKPDLGLMTPARYDIMVVLWQRPRWYRRRRRDDYEQSLAVLVEKLGLHLSTVSKCVTRMVELGLLETGIRIVRKRRHRMVKLTLRGEEAFLDANRVVLGNFLPQHHLGADTVRLLRVRARRARRRQRPRPRCVRSLRTADVVLRSIAVVLRACAQGLGSRAYSIYDPYFVDPLFPLHFGPPPSNFDARAATPRPPPRLGPYG